MPYKSNKPVKNFQKKKYYTNRNVIPNQKGITYNKKYNNYTKSYTQSEITGWFDKENNITMKEWIEGTWSWEPVSKKTIWHSKDGKKSLVLKS